MLRKGNSYHPLGRKRGIGQSEPKYGIALRPYHSGGLQPSQDQVGPAGYWLLGRARAEGVASLGVEVHFNRDARFLQRTTSHGLPATKEFLEPSMLSGPSIGRELGGVPGQIRICLCPGVGCQVCPA